MVSEKNDDDLKSFQIGLMSGTSNQKKSEVQRIEVSGEDFPAISASAKSKATFKKKTTDRVASYNDVMKSKDESAEEKERAEKAKKAWERALEVISNVSIKD
jgi:hypothetical protein